jgi:WhiB family redox-sensing transcriptional regulator
MTQLRRSSRNRLVSMTSYGTLGRSSDVSGFLASLTAPSWAAEGLCAQTDPEIFFPEKGGAVKAAKRVCAGCPVKGECLEYALENQERFGVWGGLSERERRRLLRGAA